MQMHLLKDKNNYLRTNVKVLLIRIFFNNLLSLLHCASQHAMQDFHQEAILPPHQHTAFYMTAETPARLSNGLLKINVVGSIPPLI